MKNVSDKWKIFWTNKKYFEWIKYFKWTKKLLVNKKYFEWIKNCSNK